MAGRFNEFQKALTAQARNRLAVIDVKMAAYQKASSHAQDDATWSAMEAHIDELFRERCLVLGMPEDEIFRERCRMMGVPEDEIARNEQENKAEVEKAIDQLVAQGKVRRITINGEPGVELVERPDENRFGEKDK
jgi:hypothetical protein